MKKFQRGKEILKVYCLRKKLSMYNLPQPGLLTRLMASTINRKFDIKFVTKIAQVKKTCVHQSDT